MIYLKRLEIFGFKSFADKVNMEFDKPVTAIVGPNGCGKSNVCDAVRWVLGEQSTKTLRGKTMLDLIFGGTDQRKSLGYCEVSLVFDNTTRLFPIEMDEIIVSRKLYRNNDSEYLINRNIVRLKDLTEMLRGVGLGREGYSIVGQNRMSAILTARPVDRRGIFEEALGISSFRAKKVETERKLEKTKVNLDNLNILGQELEKRIAPLTKQATVAKKYLELRDQLRYEEINAYIYSYDSASERKDSIRNKLKGLSEECNIKELRYSQIEEEYNQLLQDITQTDESLSALREQRVSLAVDIERRSGDKKVIKERYNSCENDIVSNTNDVLQLEQDIASMNQIIEEGNTLLTNRQQELAHLDDELMVLQSQYASIARETEEVRVTLDKEQQKENRINSDMSNYNIQQATLTAEVTQHNARLLQLSNQKQQLVTMLSNMSGAEGKLLSDYDSAKLAKDTLEHDIDEISANIKQQEYDIFQHNKVLSTASQAVASERGSIQLLSDFTNNYKGYQASVSSLMQNAKQDQALNSRIKGVVANLIDVDDEYLLAIETALGGRLQNVVTANEQDTKYLVSHLKQHQLGRVTFLPISSMKAQTIGNRDILRQQGVIGTAVQLVSYDKQYDSVFQSLLGGIVVVDTYDNAVALSKQYRYSYRMVTLAGERISTDGSIEGGSRKSQQASLLSYDSQLAQRKENLTKLNEHLAEVEQQHKSMQDTLKQDKKQLSALASQLAQTNVDVATFQERIDSSNIISSGDKQRLSDIEAERDQLSNSLDQIQATLVDISDSITRLDLVLIETKANILQLRSLLEMKTGAKDALAENISSKRYRLGTLRSNIDMSTKALDGNIADLNKLNSSLYSKQEYIRQLEDAKVILMETLSGDSQDSGKQEELDQLLQLINESDSRKAMMNQRYSLLGEERMQLSVELENIRGTIAKQEYILEQIDYDLDELQQRVLDEYNITYSAAMEHKDEQYAYEDSKSRITTLKQSIIRLGDINVNAIAELEEVRVRYGDIDVQLNDIKKADADLREILKQLTEEIHTRFHDGMARINENFSYCFRELFNGGNARLTLETSEGRDVLDYGVEIEAQPPGKKLQSINQLSGGEQTFTAAAILFAILKLNPMPFCVLDEIEAALDDANATKIAKYLRKFSEKTQFLVITHKKPTMENADVLYGVTMEEKGVSKVVAVKLSDAI